MSAKNVSIAIAVVLLGGAVVAANLYFKRDKGVLVTTEGVKTRDLEAIVSASGKIQPKRSVNISSDTVGRVVNLAVNEGDRVTKGQFLLQIDPKSLRTRVDSGVASLNAAQASLDQMRQSVETARAQMELAKQTLQRQQNLWKQQLTTQESLDKATNDVRVAESSLSEREKTATAQASRIAQEQAGLDSARYDLSKVRIESPIDGIVTHRSIEEGEMVVVGTMNNAGTVLMTLADMSAIQAEVEVDETNVPNVQLGQIAKITVDAIPDKSFRGHVTEIGNSPIQQSSTTGTTTAATGTQATNFKVVVVVDEPIPEVRPGFTCTADITTAKRHNVLSVPIPAVAVRELVYDANGQVVKEPRTDRRRRSSSTVEPIASAQELEPGQTRKETEGVFVFRNGLADFVPIKMGIAGERYFELLGGLQAGDQVVTGPYNSVRGMTDGDLVRVDTKKRAR
jgi:HlyD family secretion protein